MKKKNLKIPSLQKTVLTAFIGLVLWASAWLIDSWTNIRLPSNDKPVQLYSTQTSDDLRLIFSKAIQEAKHSIWLVIYSLTDDKILSDLRQKSMEGVTVHVICDAKASPYIASKLGPKVKLLRRLGEGLMHQKILVVDDTQVWMGSANMTTESLRMHGNLVTGMESPKLAKHLITKASMFTEYGQGGKIPVSECTVGDQSIEMHFLPDNQKAVKRIIQLIKSAEKSIRVAMFTWTRNDFTKEIIAARDRGVKVEVAIDFHSGKGASAKVVQLLKKNGIPTWLGPSQALLHHKFLYIDEKTLVNGSANWTKAAFTKNDDCFMILSNLTTEQQQFLDMLWINIKKESTKL